MFTCECFAISSRVLGIFLILHAVYVAAAIIASIDLPLMRLFLIIFLYMFAAVCFAGAGIASWLDILSSSLIAYARFRSVAVAVLVLVCHLLIL